jgi:hypothetical protein
MQGMGMAMNMVVGSLFKVVSANLDSKELQMTYDHMNVSSVVKHDGTETNASDSLLQTTCNNFIGKPIIFKLSNDNQITEVIGFDSLMSNYGNNETYRKTVKQMFSKEQINSMFGTMFSMYPKNTVKIGDSWNVNTPLNISGIDMGINLTYTLTEVKDGMANIKLDAVIKGKGEIKIPSGAISVDMDGSETGAIAINLSDGYMRTMNYNMNLNATMEIQGHQVSMAMKGSFLSTGN